MIRLVANIEQFDKIFTGCIENVKGLVVESDSAEGVLKELLISLKVKMAYDLGVDINSIEQRAFRSENEWEAFKELHFLDGKAKKEINLAMCP